MIKLYGDLILKYDSCLGTEVFNALTVDQFETICREWQKANDTTADGEDEDITMGES